MSAYDRVNVDYKTFNMSRLGQIRQPKEEANQVSTKISQYDIRLLQRCKSYWDALYDFRKRRRRARMYHRGDQWKDQIYDSTDGTWSSEEDYIKKQGKMPLKQNQIRQLMKNIIGQFLTDTTKVSVISRKRDEAQVGEMLTNSLQYALDINEARRIDTRAFEEFMLSGATIQKTRYKYMPKYNREDLYLENRYVPQMFFNDNIKDVRLNDMDLLGEFFDIPLETVIATFAKTPEDAKTIKQIYSSVISREDSIVSIDPQLRGTNVDNLDFYNTVEPHLCRVYEVWQKMIETRLRCHDWLKGKRFTATLDQKEKIDEINVERIQNAALQGVPAEQVPLIEYEEKVEEFWYVKFLAPYGYNLYESETVYEHKEHPYTLLLYPLIDSEVWGFVEDIIDQQRYVNRLIMLMDFIIGSSAKGVLLVPEEAIPDDMNIDDFAEEWTKHNGVIKIKTKQGVQMPKEITSKASIPGVNDLLSIQLQFMNEISGVSPAMQGQRAPSGTPAKLYAQETQNSSLNTKDYFETFNAFIRERNWKALKTIIQFYDEERKIALAGNNFSEEAMTYNPDKAKSAEVDVVMARSSDSPVYRGVIEESLQRFVEAGFLPFELYLKNSTLPYSDKLLTDLDQMKKGMAENGQVPPALMEQLGQGLQAEGGAPGQANPETLALLKKFMSDQAA